MMRTMTPMMTQSEAPACPPAPPSLPMTAAEALAAVVVLLLKGGLLVVVVVDIVASSIGCLAGGLLVVGFGSDSEVKKNYIRTRTGPHFISHSHSLWIISTQPAYQNRWIAKWQDDFVNLTFLAAKYLIKGFELCSSLLSLTWFEGDFYFFSLLSGRLGGSDDND